MTAVVGLRVKETEMHSLKKHHISQHKQHPLFTVPGKQDAIKFSPLFYRNDHNIATYPE